MLVARVLFSRPVQVLVALLFLWAWVTDAGGVRTWMTQLVVDHLVAGIRDVVMPTPGS